MIKVRHVGTYDVANVDATITSASDVRNYQFLEKGGLKYLIATDVRGDDAYKDDIVFPAGTLLTGYDLASLANRELVVDEKHIDYTGNQKYEDIVAGTTMFKYNANGNLEIIQSAPTTGGAIYFKATEKTTLTGKAVAVRIIYVV